MAEAPKDLSGYYYGYYSGYSGYYYDQAKKQEVPKEVKAEKAAWPPSSEHFGADEDDVMNNVFNHYATTVTEKTEPIAIPDAQEESKKLEDSDSKKRTHAEITNFESPKGEEDKKVEPSSGSSKNE